MGIENEKPACLSSVKESHFLACEEFLAKFLRIRAVDI